MTDGPGPLEIPAYAGPEISLPQALEDLLEERQFREARLADRVRKMLVSRESAALQLATHDKSIQILRWLMRYGAAFKVFVADMRAKGIDPETGEILEEGQ